MNTKSFKDANVLVVVGGAGLGVTSV